MDNKRAAILNNLIVVAGVKDTPTATGLLNKCLDTAIEKGFDSVSVADLTSIEYNQKRLPEKVALKVKATLTLVNLLGSDNLTSVKHPAPATTRNKSTTRRYTTDTDSAEMLRISRLVVEWRIPSDGSRPLSWKNLRAELGGLDELELREVICRSPEYLTAVKERVTELLNSREGWNNVNKLPKLTRLNAETIEQLLNM